MPEAKAKRKRVLLQRQSPDFCRTCRLRKVKCDGTRPACRNCVRGGRVCYGYTTWSLALSSSQRDFPDVATPLCAPVTFFHASDNLSRFSSVATGPAWEYYIRVAIHQQAKLHRTPQRMYAALSYMLSHPPTFNSWYHPAAACGGVWQALIPVVHTTYSYPLDMVKYDVAMNLSARAVAAGTALASSATGELVLERQYILLRSSVNLALSTGDLESVRCHLRHLFVLVHTHPEWAAKAMAGSDYLAEIVQRPLYGLEMRANDRHLTIGSGNGASLGDWMAKLVRSGKRQSTLNRTPPKPLAFTSLQDITDFLHSLQDSVWRIELGVQRASQRCVDDFLMRRPLLRRGLDLSMKECLKSCVSRFVALDAGLRKRIEDTLRGFEIWRDAFDGLMKSDSVVVARHHLLIIQAFCAHFRLVACRVIEEIGWDRHYQVFVQQIAVVTEYLRLGEYVDTTECGPPRQRPHYHSTFGEWGVLRALYLICTKCRDPNTRRKSAQLLAGARWDEGTLSSTVLANYSKAIFGAEEGRAGGISEEALVFTGIFANSIPERARFSDAVAWNDGDEKNSFQLVGGRIVREEGGYIELSSYSCSTNPVRACEKGVVEIPLPCVTEWNGDDEGACDNARFYSECHIRG